MNIKPSKDSNGNTTNTFSVINTNGLRFNLRAIFKGDKYGLNDCLINEGEQPDKNKPL